MSTLQLTFEDLVAEVCEYLGLGEDPSEDDLELAGKLVNEGYRQFLMALDPRTKRSYAWSFVDPSTTPSILTSEMTPLGGVVFSSTIRAAALSAAEHATHGVRGVHSELFDKLLAASIDIDSATRDLNIGRW